MVGGINIKYKLPPPQFIMYYYDEDYYLDDYDYLNELLEEAYYEGLYDAYLNEALTKKQKILLGLGIGAAGTAAIGIGAKYKRENDADKGFIKAVKDLSGEDISANNSKKDIRKKRRKIGDELLKEVGRYGQIPPDKLDLIDKNNSNKFYRKYGKEK